MKAMVIGSNGQDGVFLVRHLLSRGYEVMGVARQEESLLKEPPPGFSHRQVDLRENEVLAEALKRFEPDRIFHVAAVHTSAGGSYEGLFGEMLKVNTASVHTVLEYMRQRPDDVRLIYASSAKAFGDSLPARIDEETPVVSNCLYSITKNASRDLIRYYRKQHGLKASLVFLFNHESELRPDHFFIPRILQSLASALRDPSHVAEVNTLDFFCDWGSAEEYMNILIDMLEMAPSEDFVLATGKCTYARDLVERLFTSYGLDYRNHLREKVSKKGKVGEYQVDLSKLRRSIGREPCVGIDAICSFILEKRFGVAERAEDATRIQCGS